MSIFQNGTEAASQAEPTADSSPGNSISDAENFECYGEADADVPASNTLVLWSDEYTYHNMKDLDREPVYLLSTLSRFPYCSFPHRRKS